MTFGTQLVEWAGAVLYRFETVFSCGLGGWVGGFAFMQTVERITSTSVMYIFCSRESLLSEKDAVTSPPLTEHDSHFLRFL